MAGDTPGPPGAAVPGDRLESWKEIASYLGRTPRTVQRWERHEGLPVHRLVHDKLGSVYAYRSELDAWWEERRTRLAEPLAATGPAGAESGANGDTPAAAGAPSPEPGPIAEAPARSPATLRPSPETAAEAGVAYQEDGNLRVQGPASAPKRRGLRAAAVGAVVLAAVGGTLAHRLLVVSRQVRIAVLPFANLAGDPEQEYLSDGLTEEMITALGRLRPERLRVIARTSVMRYKGNTPAIDTIGSELGVDYVLEGSVRRSGDRVRVNVKLVRVDDQTPVWVDSLERRGGDVIDVEGEVARRLAGEIHLKLTPGDGARRRGPGTADPQAHEAYLRGRYFWNKRTDEGFRKSVALFEEAVARDPSYAEAWTGLADAYSLMANYSVLPVAEAFPKARRAVERALELEPELAEAHASLAFILRNHDWDFPGAEREFRRALELNSNHATTYYWFGIFLESLGRFAEADDVLRRGQALDPLSPTLESYLAHVAFLAGRQEEAIASMRRLLERDPARVNSRLDLGRALARAGRYDEAVAELNRALRDSDDHPMVVAVLGHVYGRAGRTAEARQALTHLRELSQHRHVTPYYWAVIHAGLGERDEAIAWLEKVHAERHVGVLTMAVEPELDGLRDDPRFRALARRVGLPE